MGISVAPGFLFEGTNRVIAFLARFSKTHSEANKNVQEMHIYKYDNIDPDLCPVLHLKYLIAVTDQLRCKTGRRYNSLFITEKGTPAKQDTCAKWVKEVLTKSGIDPSVYTPHSARSASACHKLKNYPLETVLSHGAWASDHTFKRHYMRPVLANPNVSVVEHPQFGCNPYINASTVCSKKQKQKRHITRLAKMRKRKVVSKHVRNYATTNNTSDTTQVYKSVKSKPSKSVSVPRSVCSSTSSRKSNRQSKNTCIKTRFSAFTACSKRSRRYPVIPTYIPTPQMQATGVPPGFHCQFDNTCHSKSNISQTKNVNTAGTEIASTSTAKTIKQPSPR